MNGKIQKGWQMGLLSAVLLGLNLPSPTLAQSLLAPPEGSVTIQGVAANGTGCPPGSVVAAITPDRSQVELLFSKFSAELDKKPTQFDSQTNCTASIQLKYPSGWSVSWDRVEQRGFVDLSGGAQGQIRNRFYIPGNGGFDISRVYNFRTNDVEDYTFVQDAISDIFTECGAQVPLNVDTRVRLYGTPTGYNTVTVDSETAKVRTLLHLTWRRC